MLISPELHTTTGFEHQKGAIDPLVAARAEQECEFLFNTETTPTQDKGETKGTITARVYTSESILEMGSTGISEILEQLGSTEGYNVSLNHQAPHSKGGFHIDGGVTESTIIQLSNDGLFDYMAQQNELSVEVGAGDKLVLLDKELIHRGQNPSDHDRYNMVVWKPAEPATMEDILRESANEVWG